MRPGQRGIRALLFDLEADIMGIVWRKGWDRFTVAQVHAELERQRAIAYTTVWTTVNRLFGKGQLTRERQGKRHEYQPVPTREALCRVMTREALESLDLTREAALELVTDRVSDASEGELADLEALICARRKELES